MTVMESSALVGQTTPPAIEPQELCLRPTRGWVAIDWAEMLRFRELLYFLVWRDYKVRYKQAVLGVAWAVLQPVCNMAIFTVIFGQLAKMPSDGYPYPVFVFAGLLPWTYFSTGVSLAGLSLANQQQLLTKVYFPRLFVPTASIGAGLLDMAIALVVYAGILLWYRQPVSWQIVLVPGLVVLTVLATLGLGLILAALTVSYRDFRYVIPFLMQIMMYLSPVVYPVTLVPDRYQWVLALNPMTGVIDGCRSAILGKPWNLMTLAVSSSSAVAVFLVGVGYFRRTERRFADVA